ncbi:MAG: hypothetical protein V3S69_07260 [Dehalococcoidales bacterium]
MNQALTRVFDFKTSYCSKFGERIELSTMYTVKLVNADGHRTYATIATDFGPDYKKSFLDVGITWKSIFRAYQWCLKHHSRHSVVWAEMDMKPTGEEQETMVNGYEVIPVEKLSTACETLRKVEI